METESLYASIFPCRKLPSPSDQNLSKLNELQSSMPICTEPSGKPEQVQALVTCYAGQLTVKTLTNSGFLNGIFATM